MSDGCRRQGPTTDQFQTAWEGWDLHLENFYCGAKPVQSLDQKDLALHSRSLTDV